MSRHQFDAQGRECLRFAALPVTHQRPHAPASQAQADAGSPASRLRRFTEELVVAANTYRGMAASLGTVLKHPARGCAAATAEGQRLLRQAQAAGVVREEVSTDDLVCVITAVSLATANPPGNPARIAYLVGLFFEGALAPSGQQ